MKQRKKHKGRKIHIDGDEYTYKIGTHGVEWRDLEGKRHFTDMSTLTGWSWDELERSRYKGFLPPQIEPSDVRKLIIQHLRGDPA